MNMKRMRGRGNHRHGGGGGGGHGGYRHAGSGASNGQPVNRNHVFDSSGPDMRMRGTAQQLFEKYLQLGRDATGAGDRVMAEAFFQHAEHYFRILGAMTQAQQPGPGGPRRYQGGGDHPGEGAEGEAEGGINGHAAGDPPESEDGRGEGVPILQ